MASLVVMTIASRWYRLEACGRCGRIAQIPLVIRGRWACHRQAVGASWGAGDMYELGGNKFLGGARLLCGSARMHEAARLWSLRPHIAHLTCNGKGVVLWSHAHVRMPCKGLRQLDSDLCVRSTAPGCHKILDTCLQSGRECIGSVILTCWVSGSGWVTGCQKRRGISARMTQSYGMLCVFGVAKKLLSRPGG